MTTAVFSRNVGKLFSELKLVPDNLLFILHNGLAQLFTPKCMVLFRAVVTGIASTAMVLFQEVLSPTSSFFLMQAWHFGQNAPCIVCYRPTFLMCFLCIPYAYLIWFCFVYCYQVRPLQGGVMNSVYSQPVTAIQEECSNRISEMDMSNFDS